MRSVNNLDRSHQNIFIAVILIFGVSFYWFGEYRYISLFSYLIAFLVLCHGALNKKNDLKFYAVLFLLSSFSVLAFFLFDSIANSILSIRFYYGLFVFVLAFRFLKLPNFSLISYCLSVITIIEYIAIKIDPNLILILPNFDETITVEYAASFQGGAYSFGGNRSISGSILAVLYVLADIRKERCRFLLLLSVICCFSGVGFAILMLHWFRKCQSHKMGFDSGKILLILIFSILFFDLEGVPFLAKWNWDYLSVLWTIKTSQFIGVFEQASFFDLVLGFGKDAFISPSSAFGGYGSAVGDFIFLDFLVRFGLIGICLFFIMFWLSASSFRNPVWYLVVASLHYYSLFSLPGQVIAGFVIEFWRRSNCGDSYSRPKYARCMRTS